MKRIDLSHVEGVLRKERGDQADLYAPPTRWALAVASGLAPLPDRFRMTVREGPEETPLRFTPTSIQQVCGIAGIPAPFLEKVPASIGLKLLRCLLEIHSGQAWHLHIEKKATDAVEVSTTEKLLCTRKCFNGIVC